MPSGRAKRIFLLSGGAIASPGAVTNLAVTGASGGTVADLTPTITFTAAPNATSHKLQWSDDNFSTITGEAEFDMPDVEYTHTVALVNFTTYKWRVAGINAGGQGPWSDTVTVQVYRPLLEELALYGDIRVALDSRTLSSMNQLSTGLGDPVASENDPIGLWSDLASDDDPATQATAGNRPLYVDGAVDFNGTDQFFQLGYTSPDNSHTIIFVHELEKLEGSAYLLDSNSGRLVISPYDNGVNQSDMAFYDGAWRYAKPATEGRQIAVWSLDADAGTHLMYRNGVEVGSGAYTGKLLNEASGGTRIGSQASSIAILYKGKLRGVYIYSGALDATAIQALTSYLQDYHDVRGFSHKGAWSWFSDPRAVRVGDKTFVSLGPALSRNSRPGIATYDHTSDISLGPTKFAILGLDDHDVPALLVRASDNKLMAFYCHHNGSEMYMQVSTNALDASAWDTAVALDASLGMDTYTYANPIQLTGETNDPIWLFFRGDPPGVDGWAQYYSKSEDDGATWAAATRWLANGSERPYVKLIQNGDSRIDFACTDGHPNEVSGNSIYHGYYEGGNWYQSDGTLVGGVGDLPFAPSAFTQVYDGSSVEAWIHDIVIDGSGNPVIAYANFVLTTDHRYRYAKWNGSAWSDNEIVAAGTYLYAAEANYSGGISIDPADVNTVYLSRETGDADWEIWRYVTTDDGATWSGTKLTTETGRALRPFVVRNHGSGKKVAYFTGTYTSYTSYDTVIKLIDG